MRTVRIMCNDHDVIYPDGHIVGKIGEHNATMLEIRTTDDFVIGCDYFSIEIFRNEHLFYSGTITDDMGGDDNSYRAGCVFYLKLWHNLTLGKQINIVVVGYKTLPDGNAEEVRRSPVIGSLLFTGAFGCDKESEYAGGITAEVAELSRRVVELKGTDDDLFTEIEAIRNDIPSSVDIARWDGAATESHTHPNKPTLDRLTEVDGVLYLDGKRLDGVIVWPIQKDPVIPAQPDGTLLYTVYGEDGLMNSDPYLVDIQGVLYRKPAPWKPGQLWVCRSGIWYLLTSESKTNFDPGEVFEGDGDIIEGGDDNIVWAPAPNPDDDALIVDGVKLLPFGVPIDLVFDKPETAHYYLADENITTNRQYLIEVKTENANRSIRIACYNGMFSVVYDEFGVGKKYYQNGSWDSEPDLSAFKIASVKFHDTVTALSLEEILANSDYLRMYTSFCQAFQSCEMQDFKRYAPIDGAYEALSDTVVCDGRVCVAKLNEYTTSIKTYRERFHGTKDGYATVYVDCDADVDVAFDVDYFVGGEVPNTKAGRHKLIYNLLPDCTVSLGALDLEAVV